MFAQLVEQWANGGAARFVHDALNHSFRRLDACQRLVIDLPSRPRLPFVRWPNHVLHSNANKIRTLRKERSKWRNS